MVCDVLIVGGGPAGLSAALALGRARRRVLLCDSGPRRNAWATHIHNFVTRDGTPPDEFRRLGREQLAPYRSVEVVDAPVASVAGARGAFRVALPGRTVEARRVLLGTGMVDLPMDIEGFREAWGTSIFQCPYCHGWERQDLRWGYLARAEDLAHVHMFAVQARAWTSSVTVFTHGALGLPDDSLALLRSAGVRVVPQVVSRLVLQLGALQAVALADGERVPCDVLFAHPPQRHVELVGLLGVALDEQGYVRVDPMKKETSVPGIFAAGDLTTRMQGAIHAASAGGQAGGAINVDVMMELAASGKLS